MTMITAATRITTTRMSRNPPTPTPIPIPMFLLRLSMTPAVEGGGGLEEGVVGALVVVGGAAFQIFTIA